jgi:hypothetical protein
MPILLEGLYEPQGGPRAAGGFAHIDRKIQEYSDVQSLDCLHPERQLLECLFSLMACIDMFPMARLNWETSVSA